MVELIFIVGSIQAFFLGILVLKKKPQKAHEKILPIWLFLIGIHLIIIYLINEGISNRFFIILHITLPLVHFPLLFLYVNELIKNTEKFRLQNLLFFIPFVLFFMLHVFITKPSLLIKYVIITQSLQPSGFIHFNLIINLLCGLICTIMSLIELKKFNEKIKTYFSNIDKINLKWLAHTIFGFSSVLFIALIYIIIFRIFNLRIEYNIDLFIYGSITLFIFFIGYYSLKKTNLINNEIFVFQNDINELRPSKPIRTQKEKYEIYGLKKDEAIVLKKKLLRLMEEKKPYLNCELSLPQLAESLGTYKHYLTQVLNDELNQNFYDFINYYRVEEVKRLMSESKYDFYKLYALALEAGFNSKSSFNRIFKNITGTTPTQYKIQNI